MAAKRPCIYILFKDDPDRRVVFDKGKTTADNQADFAQYLIDHPDSEAMKNLSIEGVKEAVPAAPGKGPMIVRHGESEANAANVRSTPETPLTEGGVQQAQELGQQMKDRGIKTIYHSDMTRSRQTAEEAAKVAGAEVKELPNSGEKLPDETDEAFVERAKKVKDEIEKLPSDDAVVSHGLLMKAIDALDQTDGDVKEAVKVYKKLPNIDNGGELKKNGEVSGESINIQNQGGQNAITQSEGPVEEGHQQSGVEEHQGTGAPRIEAPVEGSDNRDSRTNGEGQKEAEIDEPAKNPSARTPLRRPVGDPLTFDWDGYTATGTVARADDPGKVIAQVPAAGGAWTTVKLDKIIHATEDIKNWLRAKKIDSEGNVYAGVPFDKIWNSAIESTAKSFETAENFLKGVKDVIKQLHENLGDSWDKKNVFDTFKAFAAKQGYDIKDKDLQDAVDGVDIVPDVPYTSSKQTPDGATPEPTNAQKAEQMQKMDREAKKVTFSKVKDAVAKGAHNVYKQINSIKGERGRMTATTLNAAQGKMNMLLLENSARLNQMSRSLDELSGADRKKFILNIQSGQKQDTPALQKMSDELSGMLDKAAKMLSTVTDLHVLQNYFPQIWRKPEDFQRFIDKNAILSKRPVQGSAQMLKRRILEDISVGYANGFRLITDNPVRLVQMYQHSAAQLMKGYDVLTGLMDQGLAIPTKDGITDARTGQPIPPDFEKGNFSLFNSFAKKYYLDKKGEGSEGDYPYAGVMVAPETNEALYSIYGPGLGDAMGAFKAFGNLGNSLNYMQLGLSGFHFMTVTGQLMASDFGLGFQNLFAGKIGAAAESFGKGLIFPGQIIGAFKNYAKLIDRANKGSLDEGNDYQTAALQMIAKAGGALRSDPIYKVHALENARRTYYELKNSDIHAAWGVPKAAFQYMLGYTSYITNQIMEHYVPVLKTQAFMDLAQSELKLRKPVGEYETQKVLQSAWDYNENRFGEVNYDRWFMNRMMKEASFMGFRAMGWTFANVKQYGGSLSTGLVHSAKRIAKGEGLNPDTAFTMGLMTSSALVCGLFNYFMKGGIHDIRDFVSIRTGDKNKDGSDIRRVPFAHLREIYQYTKEVPYYIQQGKIGAAGGQLTTNFMHEMSNKLNPSITFTQQILQNKDYFNEPIMFHPNWFPEFANDPQGIKAALVNNKIADGLNYIAAQYVPIAFRDETGKNNNLLSLDYWHRQLTPDAFAQKFGIVTAPMNFDRQTYQNVVMDAYYKSMDTKHIDFDKKYLSVANEIQKGIANINIGDPVANKRAIQSLIDQAKSDGILTNRNTYEYFAKKNANYFQDRFASLGAQEQMDILAKKVIPPELMESYLKGFNYDSHKTARQQIVSWCKKNKDIVAGYGPYQDILDMVSGKPQGTTTKAVEKEVVNGGGNSTLSF